MPQERRTVTILFSDLEGFTALSERMDPEDVQELVGSLNGEFRKIIEREGGTVDKFIGDAVMALFGAQHAHEDDPLRAVRAGLAMQREIGRFNTARGLSLSVRVGINSGEVMWGEMAGAAPTVMGDAVNVAQRLESACDPGKVLVSETVARETEGRVRCRRIDARRVKGREETVQACEVLGLVEGATLYRRVRGVSVRMHGRAEALEALRERWRRVTAAAVSPLSVSSSVSSSVSVSSSLPSSVVHRPSFVAVEGEAGIGKSRLLWEFRRELADGPERVQGMLGRCREGSPLPLEPFAQMIAARAGVALADPGAWNGLVRRLTDDFDGTAHDTIQRENLAHLIALSVGVDVPGARVKHIEPTRMAEEMKHAWHEWVKALAARGPLVLTLEDLHWAHEGTLDLLEYWSDRLKDERVLVTVSRRPEGREPRGFERLTLGGLDEATCGAVAEEVLKAPVSDDLRRFLVEKTGGNPYYLEELARYLRESGLLDESSVSSVVSVNPKPETQKPETLLVLKPGPVKVPNSLQGLLVGRIDDLGEVEKTVLKGASAVGRVFWRGVLEGALECTAEAALECAAEAALEGLQAREMIFRHTESELPGEVEYVFKHALLRDAAYSLLTKKERARLHGALAKVLAGKGTTRAKALAAGHWSASGETGRAQALYGEVARESLERSAFEETLEYARQGGCVLLRARALSGLARYDEALEAVGEVLRSSESGVQGPESGVQGPESRVPGPESEVPSQRLPTLDFGIRTLAPGLATAEERGRALLVAADVHEKRGEFEQALRVAEEVLGGAGMASLRAEAIRAKGFALCFLGRYDDALAVAGDDAVEVPRGAAHLADVPQADRKGVASRLHLLANVHYARGEHARAMELYEESLALVRSIGDRHGVAIVLNNIGNLQHARGEYAEALRAHVESLAVAREIGDRHGIASSLSNIGGVHFAWGREAEAMREYQESMSIRREIGDRYGIALGLTNIGNVHFARGEYAEAMEAQEESLAMARGIGNLYCVATSLNNIGIVHHARGELAEAMKRFEESLAIRREIGDRRGIATSLNNIGDVHRARGDFAEAMKAQGESLAMAREIGDRRMVVETVISEAETLIAMGRGTEGEERFAEGVRLAGEIGLKESLARALAARSGHRAGSTRSHPDTPPSSDGLVE